MRCTDSWAGHATILLALSILACSMQARALSPIDDHYFGATLFVVKTGHMVWPPVAVSSLPEYESTYGLTSGPATDHGHQAARLFFANGGETLYVIDPQGSQAQDFADALTASVDVPVDLVAMPGAACCSDTPLQHEAMMSALSQHVDASPNRFGLIDAPLDSDADALLDYRTAFSSEHTALYAPWLVLDGPDPGNSTTVPPSSAVAGVISRIDRQDGIHKTPAGPNAKLLSPPVTDIERAFNPTERNSLNAANINLLGHFVSSTSVHIWGTRTTGDAPDRLYVNVARFLRHLEFSMNRSLATAFDSPPTAADVTTVETLVGNYLHDYWQQGALLGASASEAYFVDCQIASPGLHCTVGVATIKPAEFQMFPLAIPYSGDIFSSRFEAE